MKKRGTPHFWRMEFRKIEERAQRPGRMGGSIIRSEIVQQDTTMQERIAPAAQRAAEQDEDTIDLLELALGLLEHWKLIAVTAVTGAVLMALYTFFLVTPMYKATATIYVVSRNDSVLNFSDLQVGSELTSDVSRQELLDVKQQIEQTGCPILGTVLNQVDYDNYMGRKYYKSYSKYGKYGYYRKYYKRSHEAEKK